MALDLNTQYKNLVDKVINKPLGALPDRRTPLTEEYVSQTKPTDFYDEPRWKAPSSEAYHAQMPASTGGGVYVSDPADYSSLIKTTRAYTPITQEENRTYRKGLPSWGFEVDHIIPLALGGSDVESNKEVLAKDKHELKTKVGAVAQELYFNGELSLPEARNLVINWEDKDVSKVKLNDKGATDLETARQVRENWKKVPKLTFKKWWESFKEAPEEMMPDTVAGEFGKGLMSGVAMGYTNNEVNKFDDPTTQTLANVANVTGNVVGTIASLFAGGALIKGAANLTRGASFLQGTKIPALIKSVQGLEKAKGTVGIGKIVVKKPLLYELLVNEGIFALHGQLSKQEEKGVEARVKRLVSDLAWGGAMTIAPGYKGLDLKGGLKNSSKIFTASYLLSMALGDDPKEAFIAATTMTGLHGVGSALDSSRLDAVGNKVALDYRRGLGSKATLGKVFTKEEIHAENKILKEKILAKGLSPEETEAELARVLISGRQLYKGGLTTEERLIEDALDYNSLKLRLRNLTKPKIDRVPSDVVPYLDNLAKSKGKSFEITAKDVDSKLANKEIVLTGVASNTDKATTKSIKNFMANGAKEGDEIIIYPRKDMTEQMKQVEAKKPVTERSDPANNLQAFGKIGDDSYQLGFTPSKTRISTGKYNINESLSKYDIPGMDPNFDKDFIANQLKDENLDALVVKIKGMGIAEGSKEPWIRLEVTPETIAKSRQLSTSTAKTDITKTKATSTVKAIDDVFVTPESTESAHEVFQKVFGVSVDEEPALAAIRTIERMIPKSDEAIANTFNKLVITDLPANELAELAENLRTAKVTVKNFKDFLEVMDNRNKLSSWGKQFYVSISNFYTNLSPEGRALFNKTTLNKSTRDKLGEISQKVVVPKSTGGENQRSFVISLQEQADKEGKDVMQESLQKAAKSVEEGPLKKEVQSNLAKKDIEAESKVFNLESLSDLKQLIKKAKAEKNTARVQEYSQLLNDVYEKRRAPSNLEVRVGTSNSKRSLASDRIDKEKVSLAKRIIEDTRDTLDDLKISKDMDSYIRRVKGLVVRAVQVGKTPLNTAAKEEAKKMAKVDLIPYAEDLIFSRFGKREVEEFSVQNAMRNLRKNDEAGLNKLLAIDKMNGTERMRNIEEYVREDIQKKLGTYNYDGPKVEKKFDMSTAVELAHDLKIGKNSTNPKARAFNLVLDDGLSAAFGKNYHKRKDLMKTVKNFLKDSTETWDERQPRDVLINKAEKYKLGKKLTKDEEEYIYGRRKAEANRQADEKLDRQYAVSDATGLTTTDGDKGISYGTGKSKAGLSEELNKMGLHVTEEGAEPFMYDLTYFDELLGKMRALEAGGTVKDEAEAVDFIAQDAGALLINIIKKYNLDNSKKTRIPPEDLKAIIKKATTK